MIQATAERVWAIDTAASRIDFVARHLVIHPVRGSFARWNASVEIDERDLARSFVRASIAIASIDTGNADRDEHLQALFDSAHHPAATFESTRVIPTASGLDVIGDLTLHGITHEITLEVDVTRREGRMVFTAKTAISRKRFGIVWSPAIELSSGVSDRVAIELHVEMTR